MIRLCLIVLICASPALAQQATPILETTVEPAQTVPGQPVTLRVKVLVPSWMPTPPVYPNLEQPDLMVRLPDRATSPVSETVQGETWSGTTRRYQLYPLVPGTFQITDQSVTVTYADPGNSDPIIAELPLEGIQIAAAVPTAAASLDPFLAGTALTLTQEITGLPEGPLQVGDAVTRTVTATLTGSTPIMLPDLLAPLADGPLRAYPDDPVVSETENRGILSGMRRQRVSYVAQSGGTATLPDITLDWYNLKTGKIETATLPGQELTVAAPPPPPPDPRQIIAWVLGAAIALGLGAVTWRRLSPGLLRWRAARHAAWLHSESHAAQQVETALKSGDLGRCLEAIDSWSRHHPGVTQTPHWAALQAALLSQGAAQYGAAHAGQDRPPGWDSARHAFATLRKHSRHSDAAPALPPLNA